MWRWVVGLVVLAVVFIASWTVYSASHMPGKSYSGPRIPLNSSESQLRDRLRSHIEVLASQIGERNMFKYNELVRASRYIETQLQSYGYTTSVQPFSVADREARNISCEIRGTSRPDELILIGAHYDSVFGTPGANDNASGTAAVLELARLLKGKAFDRTVVFALFANEEPPYFQTESMGSLVFARSLRDANRKVAGMISLETIGYYSDAENSQRHPAGLSSLYTSKGNFIGFISNSRSGHLLKRVVKTFRAHATIPSEGLVAPEGMQGISWSDQWSFWQQGYPALMVTDTAFFRYPYYHQPSDTIDKVDFDNVARVVSGIESVIEDLGNAH